MLFNRWRLLALAVSGVPCECRTSPAQTASLAAQHQIHTLFDEDPVVVCTIVCSRTCLWASSMAGVSNTTCLTRASAPQEPLQHTLQANKEHLFTGLRLIVRSRHHGAHAAEPFPGGRRARGTAPRSGGSGCQPSHLVPGSHAAQAPGRLHDGRLW